MTIGEMKTVELYDSLNVLLGKIIENQNVLNGLRNILITNIMLSTVSIGIGIAILIQLKKLKDKP